MGVWRGFDECFYTLNRACPLKGSQPARVGNSAPTSVTGQRRQIAFAVAHVEPDQSNLLKRNLEEAENS